jgi:hypothetical protein
MVRPDGYVHARWRKPTRRDILLALAAFRLEAEMPVSFRTEDLV